MKDFPQIGGIVIQGTVGQGKSIFLRYLCIQELQNQSSGRIPVLVELRKLDSENGLKTAVFSALENLGFEVNDELFSFYADSGKVVLLLDGFDELNEGQILPVIRQLEGWAEKHPNFQTIVSSRPGGEIQKSVHFTVIQLAPLGNDDHKPFLYKIGVKGKQLENLLNAVDQSPSEIKEFLNTPLLLTLLTMVYQSEGSIPAELPEFFQILFTTVFSKHDGTKPGFKRPRRTGFNDRDLELLFEGFSFAVLRKNYGVNLDEDQFATAFDEAIKYRGDRDDQCDSAAFRHDLVKVACLLVEDGFKLAFAHKSLLEYFCASFIKHSTEIQAKKIYNSIKMQHQWRPILQYAKYIDKYKYAKFFAIPKMSETFTALGISPDVISSQNAEDVFNFMFRDSLTRFQRDNESGKFKQGSFYKYHLIDTLYGEQLFFSILHRAFPFDFKGLTLDEIKSLTPNFDEAWRNEGVESFELPWINLLTEEIKTEILDMLLNQLRELSDQYNNYVSYVNSEDEKANEFALFG